MRDGIVPLLDGADRIWTFLRNLAGQRVSDAEWATLRKQVDAGDGQTPYAHRRRFDGGLAHGPLGWLIRGMALVSRTGQTDILRDGPEALQDVCRGIAAFDGPTLYAEAMVATTPCIVKFRTDEPDPDVMGGLLYYLWSARRGDDLIPCSCGLLAHDARGRPIAPTEIVHVERIPSVTSPLAAIAAEPLLSAQFARERGTNSGGLARPQSGDPRKFLPFEYGLVPNSPRARPFALRRAQRGRACLFESSRPYHTHARLSCRTSAFAPKRRSGLPSSWEGGSPRRNPWTGCHATRPRRPAGPPPLACPYSSGRCRVS